MDKAKQKPITFMVRLNLEEAEAWLSGTDVPEIQDVIQAGVTRKRERLEVKAKDKERQEGLAADLIAADKAAFTAGQPLTDKDRKHVYRKLRRERNRIAYKIYRDWVRSVTHVALIDADGNELGAEEED